ncbi:SH3 domain-containing protein [Streptomyces sp. NPDC001840]
MRTITTAALLAAILVPPAVIEPAHATPIGARQVVTADFNSCGYEVKAKAVKLRTRPGARHKAVGVLYRGDAVYATKSKGSWYRVETHFRRTKSGLPIGTRGWVGKKHLQESVCMQLD